MGLTAFIVLSACDPMAKEEIEPGLQESSTAQAEGENFRKALEEQTQLVQKLKRNYGLAEGSYSNLAHAIPLEMAKRYAASSRSKEEFGRMMILKSLEIFDETIQNKGQFLSPISRRRHQQTAGDEHEIEYDILAFDDDEAAFDYYIKIPDIDGESDEEEPTEEEEMRGGFPISMIIGNSSTTTTDCGKAADKNPFCASLKRIKFDQLMELYKSVPTLKRGIFSPADAEEALNELSINAGLDPVPVALLLPAVQKYAETPQANSDGHKDWINLLSLHFEVDLNPERGRMYYYGAGGTIFGLINEKYDSSGDLDWASVQLNRRKFEFEMILFWSTFWDQQQPEEFPRR